MPCGHKAALPVGWEVEEGIQRAGLGDLCWHRACMDSLGQLSCPRMKVVEIGSPASLQAF